MELLLSIIILILSFLVVLLVRKVRQSHPASTEQKAALLHDWFAAHPNPTYASYKLTFSDISNIVEYEEIKLLQQNNTLTIPNIIKILDD